jgi:ribosomal protein L12E/L44/L45/RPP1/RPP2
MEAFSMLAKDGRDSISISDLRSTLTKDGSSKVSEADIQSLLSQVGVTGDGELRIEEFERLWKSFQSPNSKEAVKQTGAAAAAPTEGAPIIAPRGSLPILPTAAPKPTPAVAPAAKPAAVKSAVEIGAKLNEAFVFIKPHANNAEVQNLVRAKFVEKGIEIVSEGEINGATIDSNGFIDQHYYSIASKAMPSTPAEPGLPLMTSDDLLYQATPSTPAEP